MDRSIIIIFFIIINIIIISFMQSICTYIPETNYVPREYSVTAILLLLFMVLISLVSASFLITFLSSEIAKSINIHVPFSLSRCYYYYYYYILCKESVRQW